MALTINDLWTGMLLIEMLAKALPFAFFKNLDRFFTNLPLPEIILAISTFTMNNTTKQAKFASFILYASQVAFKKGVENFTRSDYKNAFQYILTIPSQILTSIESGIILIVIICIVIWILHQLSAVVTTTVSSILAAISTLVSKIIKPISVSASFNALCLLISALFQPISVNDIAKYVCILVLVAPFIFGFVLVILSNFTTIDVNEIILKIVNFYFTTCMTPEQPMPPILMNDH